MTDDQTYGEFRAAHANRAARRREPQSGDDMFRGKGALSGGTMLKHVRYISDLELAEAATFPADVKTVSGRPVREAARAEIKRRNQEKP